MFVLKKRVYKKVLLVDESSYKSLTRSISPSRENSLICFFYISPSLILTLCFHI